MIVVKKYLVLSIVDGTAVVMSTILQILFSQLSLMILCYLVKVSEAPWLQGTLMVPAHTHSCHLRLSKELPTIFNSHQMTMPFGDKNFCTGNSVLLLSFKKHPIFILEWMGRFVLKKNHFLLETKTCTTILCSYTATSLNNKIKVRDSQVKNPAGLLGGN